VRLASVHCLSCSFFALLRFLVSRRRLEPPIGPLAAAVASAIRDALGSRPTVLPIAPERVPACANGKL
jgi:hypothetical protein